MTSNGKKSKIFSSDEMGIIGNSPVIQQIRAIIQQIAPTNIPVLILGESGSGKELVARAIHQHSTRSKNRMIIVNCGAIPEGILESELFGHQRGAFTGAVESRKGYFELADGGTLFLDEIGEMPLETQVKVLRVLEDKEFLRVGGSTPQKVDVRIIAATNRDLGAAVKEGEFRLDLYYRINAVKIVLPPLRKRKEDIPLLVKKFAKEICAENHIDFKGFTPEALKAFQEYSWPGNIRELKNFVQMIIILEKGESITRKMVYEHFGQQETVDRNLLVPLNIPTDKAERELIYRVLLELRSEIAQIKDFLFSNLPASHKVLPSSLPVWTGPVRNSRIPVEEATIVPETDNKIPTLEKAEKELILRALDKSNWNKRKAAKLLDISERTLYRKIKEYDFDNYKKIQ
ncbi:transcriptional regulatory protein ZraR [bacterium BMS3Bbin03]|nr:transcriptional regulatory protein ZraR [bacterium BMS3Bbin03]HDZ12400.1 sigma-54-dependent Fis family transcriptional regulator [Bacteroidota bacterium]